jgi:hypothetical protein
VAERWRARRASDSRRRVARSMLEERAEERAAWEARREGWMACGLLVRALRRDGLERMSAMSCFLGGCQYNVSICSYRLSLSLSLSLSVCVCVCVCV